MIKSERYLSLKEGFMPLTEDIYILSPETHPQTSHDDAHESEYHAMSLGQNEGKIIPKAFNLDTHEDIQKSAIDKIDTLTLEALSFASIDAQGESTLIDESSKEDKESTLKLVKSNSSETKYCCECQSNNKTNRWFMFLFFLV